MPARPGGVVHRIGARMEAQSGAAERSPEERRQRIRRWAAMSALALAILIVLYLLLLGGGGGYTVTASFANASQLVTGNDVDVAGAPVGSIDSISLSQDG